MIVLLRKQKYCVGCIVRLCYGDTSANVLQPPIVLLQRSGSFSNVRDPSPTSDITIATCNKESAHVRLCKSNEKLR